MYSFRGFSSVYLLAPATDLLFHVELAGHDGLNSHTTVFQHSRHNSARGFQGWAVLDLVDELSTFHLVEGWEVPGMGVV